MKNNKLLVGTIMIGAEFDREERDLIFLQL
jgi:hypothetical protein